MRLFLVRHGETYANEKNLTCGWYNSKLTKKGKDQAAKLAQRLSKEKIDVVFCSDLVRCKQTIAPYIRMSKKRVHYTKQLREQRYGIFEGKPTKKMIEWFKKNPGKEPEGWENKEHLKERVMTFITRDLSPLKGKNILLSTHGRTKKAILEVLFAHSQEIQEKIKKNAPNTSLTIVDLQDSYGPILELLHCDKHVHEDNKILK